MITLDLSNWLSDWLCHFLSSGAAALLAFFLTATILLVLFNSVDSQETFFATLRQPLVALGILSTSLAAALYSSVALHLAQDFFWGPWIHIEFVWRIL